MAKSKWPLVIAAGVGVVWGGAKGIDWISSSYVESSASARVATLFSNLQANADSTKAVAMWLTGSMETGSRQLDHETWNAQYGRMMSWLGSGGLRYPVSRYAIVRTAREHASQGPSDVSVVVSSAVIVTCEVDGHTVFVRAIDGRELEWAASSGE